MKNRKKIKSIFLKISRISLILFLVVLAILIGHTMMTKDEVISFPTFLGILFLICMILFLICIIIAWILDLIESIRRDKVSCLTGYVISIILLWVTIVGTDYFFGDIVIDWKRSFLKAAITVCAIKAGSYIFEKEKSR